MEARAPIVICGPSRSCTADLDDHRRSTFVCVFSKFFKHFSTGTGIHASFCMHFRPGATLILMLLSIKLITNTFDFDFLKWHHPFIQSFFWLWIYHYLSGLTRSAGFHKGMAQSDEWHSFSSHQWLVKVSIRIFLHRISKQFLLKKLISEQIWVNSSIFAISLWSFIS